MVIGREKEENSLMLLTNALNGESFGLAKSPISQVPSSFGFEDSRPTSKSVVYTTSAFESLTSDALHNSQSRRKFR